MSLKLKRIHVIFIAIGIILLIPIVAMQFTSEVNWSLFDFLVMGSLLLGTGLLCELILRKVKNANQRIIFCVVILILLFLLWAELAVGIFGSPIAGS